MPAIRLPFLRAYKVASHANLGFANANASRPLSTSICFLRADRRVENRAIVEGGICKTPEVDAEDDRARGLGNSIAEACAEADAKAIIIFDANQDLGNQSAAELHQRTGVSVRFDNVDVRDGGAIVEAVNAVVECYGAPDVLIDSAGIADSNIKAGEYDYSMFRRLIDINLTGSFLMAQSAHR
ncbi:hypothetical protein V498_08433 [Pseudogymnoascus sp. VKM F-4517 (FW-2822)]|nr:hypothetical protein V498_08433 [Pseudogymnoascus sp. VKM F-4517 (FW-2822)]